MRGELNCRCVASVVIYSSLLMLGDGRSQSVKQRGEMRGAKTEVRLEFRENIDDFAQSNSPPLSRLSVVAIVSIPSAQLRNKIIAKFRTFRWRIT